MLVSPACLEEEDPVPIEHHLIAVSASYPPSFSTPASLPPPPHTRRGWMWLFLLEGLPSIILGALIFVLLPNNIETAMFLTLEEREALSAAVARDHVPGPLASDLKGALVLFKMVFANRYFWVIFFCGVLMSVAGATYTTYTPIIISNLLNGTALNNKATVAAAKGSKSLMPVALAMVPYTLAVLFSYIVAHSSQKRNELFLHISACLLTAGVTMSLFSTLATASVAAGFIALSLSLSICFASNGPGMVLVARLCKGREAVLAQPTSNTFNMVGGVIGPLITAALMNKLVSWFGGLGIGAIISRLMFWGHFCLTQLTPEQSTCS